MFSPMPTKSQWSFFLAWTRAVFPLVIAIGFTVYSLYQYRADAEFKNDLMIEIRSTFATQKDVDFEIAKIDFKLAEKTSIERNAVFKTRTNTELANLTTETNIQAAVVSGQLRRLETDVREINTEIKDLTKLFTSYISRQQGS